MTSAETNNNNMTIEEMELSPVSRMFDGRSVFITGASGFIGRVLLEKLLRTYPGIKRIYILMRPKRNQQPYDRLHKQLLKVPIFDTIRAMPNGEEILAKLVIVTGDIAEPQLGINEHDMQMMIKDPTLSIVFHSAATIKFDEPLKVSVQLNLIATRTIIEICRRLPNLISLCHVSTAYVNSDMKQNQDIEERLYPIKANPQQMIKMAEAMDENLMQLLKVELVDERPNTYTYTKALAEHLIATEATDLPVAVVRPSIVVAAWREPIPGWIDNLNGPTGLILAIGKGLLRSMYTLRDCKADIVPVDVVVNAMIAASFYAAKINNKLSNSCPIDSTGNVQTRTKITDLKKTRADGLVAAGGGREIKNIENTVSSENSTPKLINSAKVNGSCTSNGSCLKLQPNDEVNEKLANGRLANEISSSNYSQKPKRNDNVDRLPIFQCVSGDTKPIRWGEMEDLFFPIIKKYPSAQVFRWPNGSFKGNKLQDSLTRLFVHYLPALIIDFLCLIMGKKRQLLSIYGKLHSAVGTLAHFRTTNYNFRSDNLRRLREMLSEHDRRQLYMDLESLDWLSFWDDYVLGARRFVLKESDHTLDEARRSTHRMIANAAGESPTHTLWNFTGSARGSFTVLFGLVGILSPGHYSGGRILYKSSVNGLILSYIPISPLVPPKCSGVTAVSWPVVGVAIVAGVPRNIDQVRLR